MSTRAQIVNSLRAAEAESGTGTPNPEKLYAILNAVKNIARTADNAGIARRLGLLYRRAGKLGEAETCLALAHEMDAADRAASLQLANVRIEMGKNAEAFGFLLELTKEPGCDAAIVTKAAALARTLGDTGAALLLRRKAAQADRRAVPALISELTAHSMADEALSLVRAQIASGTRDPRLAFQCYNAIKKFSADAEEVARARRLVLDAGSADGWENFWLARLHRRDGELELALSAISSLESPVLSDPEVLRERAAIALALGNWGRDADAIAGAIGVSDGFPQLCRDIASADGFLRFFGGTLTVAAADPGRFAHVRTPESVFEFVSETAPPPRQNPAGGIVMIASSLAAGGAERIVATCAGHISRDPRLNGLKLYLFDISPESGRDYYLPLARLSSEEIVLLDADCEVSEPLCFLPQAAGKRVQSILNQLRKDRPRIVHASLEPLCLYAGLAAVMAQTENIVLHTHNMRPTALDPDGLLAPRLRDCYRALLRRPEVSLVGCADACVEDYRDWLGLETSARIHAVHNGIAFEEPVETGRAEAIGNLRNGYGLDANSPVIGTAFRFEEVKRPFMWVDIAAAVHARRPDCQFVMFGDGTLRTSVQEYARSRNLEGAIEFPGLVPDLYQKLMLLDLFVLSSRIEALPNVLIEAQACGVPVLAYNVGGIAETMIDGVTGALVNVETADAMADAVLRALTDSAWCEAARRTGMEFVRREFSIGRMVEKLVEVLLAGNVPAERR